MKHLKKKESAGHDLTIIQNIPADQLEALKTTYEFMLEAVTEALRNKRAAEKQTARIIALGDTNAARHDRRCLKIAAMMRRNYSPAEISLRFGCDLGGRTHIRHLGAHGRALYRAHVVQARKNHVINAYESGLGPRPAARSMPPALGSCSCSYACKIIKAHNMRQQAPIPFPLAAV